MKNKTKRNAVNCLLVEENKHSGYHKYIIDIQEEDGTIKTGIPVFGTDMQDAIKRLVSIERAEKIKKVYTNKVEPTFLIVSVISWITTVAISAITDNYRYAFYGVIGIVSLTAAVATYKFFRNL